VVKHTLRKKHELLTKERLSQRGFTLLCPLVSEAPPRWTVYHAFFSYGA